MNKNMKKYIITSLTLCAIGAAAALVIGGTHLLTKDRIAQNEKEKQKKALKEVFESADKFSEAANDFVISKHNYLQNYYIAYSEEVELGYVYLVDGKNAYGEISLMVGITDAGIGQISIITNTQTYGTTLEDNYITPYQNGTSSLDDVSCGATYGAKLIQSMTKQANEDYLARKEVK